jgi:type II secretory ATPase GspE/PulE/Tfp pilus assembly ATPase PilB-like protein
MICKNCRKEKKKERGSLMRDGKRFFYVDENGNLWNGRQCPDCNKKRCKNKMAEIRRSKTFNVKDIIG